MIEFQWQLEMYERSEYLRFQISNCSRSSNGMGHSNVAALMSLYLLQQAQTMSDEARISRDEVVRGGGKRRSTTRNAVLRVFCFLRL